MNLVCVGGTIQAHKSAPQNAKGVRKKNTGKSSQTGRDWGGMSIKYNALTLLGAVTKKKQ